MRHLTLVGVIRNRKVVRLAAKCAWCDRWFSKDDKLAAEQGAKVTHGMCGQCAEGFLAKLSTDHHSPEAA